MLFNKGTEHALRVLYYMQRSVKEKHSVRELSRELHIPYKYLGRIMPRLVEGGVLRSIQGSEGGYELLGKVGELHLSDIMRMLDGEDVLKACVLGFAECSDEHPCAIHHDWVPIREKMRLLLDDKELKEVFSRTVGKV